MEAFVYALAAIGALCLIGLTALALWTWLAGTEEVTDIRIDGWEPDPSDVARIEQIVQDHIGD